MALLDNFAAISHPGVHIAMTYPSKQGGARSAPPGFKVYLMAIFTPGCEISAKLSMRDTSVHTSLPGTHGLDKTGCTARRLIKQGAVWGGCTVRLRRASVAAVRHEHWRDPACGVFPVLVELLWLPLFDLCVGKSRQRLKKGFRHIV